METSSQRNKERALLKKYLAGKCSPEEEQSVEDWYQSFNNSPLPKRLLESSAIKRTKIRLLKQLGIDHSNVLRLSVFFRIAAILILVASISLVIYVGSGLTFAEIKEYHAKSGEQKKITLDDGSVVTLNSMSTLRISRAFNRSLREVELFGEAYFEVSKDAKRPFIVRTGTIKTRVLGTAFNIQAYNNENDFTVAVAEGKVRVDKDITESKQSNLSPGVLPGRLLVYNKNTKTVMEIFADVKRIAAWRSGTLYFDNESIPAIAKKLERKFNLKIDVIGNTSPDCRYTLRISDETLGKTLEVLNSVSGVTYNFNQQNHLIINTTACK